MPAIKSSADLRNNYNEISTFCHNYPEPVFITKNGREDCRTYRCLLHPVCPGEQEQQRHLH